MHKRTNANLDLLQPTAVLLKLFSNRYSIFWKHVPVTSTFLDSYVLIVNHFMWLSFDRFLHYLDLNSFPLSRSTMEALADTYMAQ